MFGVVVRAFDLLAWPRLGRFVCWNRFRVGTVRTCRELYAQRGQGQRLASCVVWHVLGRVDVTAVKATARYGGLTIATDSECGRGAMVVDCSVTGWWTFLDDSGVRDAMGKVSARCDGTRAGKRWV
jgi:hypothetical protein